MLKKTYSIILFLVLCNFSFGQNQFSEKIKFDCGKMADAMLQKNYSTIIDYTYPKIVEMGGGKPALLKAIESSFKKMKEALNLKKLLLESLKRYMWPARNYIVLFRKH